MDARFKMNPPDDEIRLLQQEICRFAKRAGARRLFDGAFGALGVRVPGRPLALVTGTGLDLDRIMPVDTILCDLDGNLAVSGAAEPPGDLSFILNAFKRRRFLGAIGHFYPPYATAFSCAAETIPLVTEPAKRILKEILPVKCTSCPHRFEGLCECQEGQRKSYAAVDQLLIKNDGIVLTGRDLADVFERALLLEHTAKVAYLMRRTGQNH